jgi:hypothetical protein
MLDALGDLALHATAAGCDPADALLEVVAYDPQDAAALGLSRVDAAVSTRSTLTQAQILSDAIPFPGARVDAAVSSRLAAAGYTAPDNTGIAEANAHAHAIDTRLPSDPADESLLEAAIATRAAPGDAMSLQAGVITAIQSGLATDAALAVIDKILRNKQVTDPVAGTLTVYADDGVTPYLVASLFEDAAGATPYRGQGAERRERLA